MLLCTATRCAMSSSSLTQVEPFHVIAPMTQLNTPYPSTAYLTGFLRSRGVSAVQEDLALALALLAVGATRTPQNQQLAAA